MNCLVSTPSCPHRVQEESPEVVPFANQLLCNTVTHQAHRIQRRGSEELGFFKHSLPAAKARAAELSHRSTRHTGRATPTPPHTLALKVSYFIQGEIRLVNLPQRVSQKVEHEFLYLKDICSPELLQSPRET